MLDLSADAAGDIDLRADGLAGLSHLVGVGNPICIPGGARGTDAGSDDFCKLAEYFTVFGRLPAAST